MGLGQGWKGKNQLGQIQTHPNTQPSGSREHNIELIPVNPQVFLVVARPVDCNLWFWLTGFSIHDPVQVLYR
jgi:hypothetical protein